MKTSKFLLLFLLIGLLSCKKDDDNKTTYLVNYKKSLNTWNELKAENGNSYTYKTTFISWVGGGSTTELKVENGKVTGRNYQQFIIDNAGQRTVIDSYTETELEVGTHEKGARPLTIDQLYSSCIGEYLVVDDKTNTIYFETDANGIMTSCGFVPDNCADDCFSGVTINGLNWL